jgi:putative phosphoesterase
MSDEASPILCVGDIADGRGELSRACKLLVDHQVICVRGNHDRWALEGAHRDVPDASFLDDESRSFLQRLPTTIEFRTPIGGLLLCHGLDRDDMAELRPRTHERELAELEALQTLARRRSIAVVVGGHTHTPMVRVVGHQTFINPGTLRGRPDRPPTFMVLELDQGLVRHFEWTGATPRPCAQIAIQSSAAEPSA